MPNGAVTTHVAVRDAGSLSRRIRRGPRCAVDLRGRRSGCGSLTRVAALLVGGGHAPARRRRRLAGRGGDGKTALAVVHELLEVIARDRLVLEKVGDQRVELVAVLAEHLVCALARAVDDEVDLGVDDLRGLFRVVPLLLDLAAEEDELVRPAVLERAELLAHAVLRHHLARHLRRLLDVVRGAGRDVAAEVQLLRGPAAEGGRDVVLEFLLRAEVAVLLRQGPGDAHGHAAGDDRDLVDRVRVRQELEAERVATLVVGHDDLLLLADDARAALGPERDLLEGLLELGLADELLVPARGEDRRLVHHVREIRTGEAGRDLRDAQQVDRLLERLAADVDVEDRAAALDVGTVEHDLAVEAAGTEEGGVEDVGAVRRGEDDDVRPGVEAVHLDEDLVQRLLALVVRAAEACAALAADRVDLVDEHDAGRVALRLVEEVAHARRTHTDEHLHELGSRDREEGDAGLAGDGAREHGLAGAGWPDEEHTARDPRAEARELLRVLEELDDLGELLLRLVDAGDVLERRRRLVADEHARAALAERERLVIRALRLTHHVDEEATDEQHRQEAQQERADEAESLALRLVLEVHDAARVRPVVLEDRLLEPLVAVVDRRDLLLAVGDELDRRLVPADRDALDLAGLDGLDGVRDVDLLGSRGL